MKALWKYPAFFGGWAFNRRRFGWHTVLWETIPDEFPSGLKALQEKNRVEFPRVVRDGSLRNRPTFKIQMP